jgi:hypothetical protein
MSCEDVLQKTLEKDEKVRKEIGPDELSKIYINLGGRITIRGIKCIYLTDKRLIIVYKENAGNTESLYLSDISGIVDKDLGKVLNTLAAQIGLFCIFLVIMVFIIFSKGLDTTKTLMLFISAVFFIIAYFKLKTIQKIKKLKCVEVSLTGKSDVENVVRKGLNMEPDKEIKFIGEPRIITELSMTLKQQINNKFT